MRILMVGAPGSGKGTQGARIAAHLGVEHISSGDLLRRHVAGNTALGRSIAEILRRGDLVGDAVVLDMLRKPLVDAGRAGGYVLDGFPRTVAQAEAVYLVARELDVAVQVVVLLEVDEEELIRRLRARATEDGRADDVDTAIRHRLDVNHAVTRPLRDYFQSRCVVIRVDGRPPADEVTADILRRLDALDSRQQSPQPPTASREPAADGWVHRATEPREALDPVLELHRGGKIGVSLTKPLDTLADLSAAYTPGVARVCTTIAQRPSAAYDYTWKPSTVAVVTDGTAVLGLGDIGPLAALPVMEGKAMLFKRFGGLNAVPVCLDCTGVDEIVDTVVRLAPAFGGINLEDISAPRCFEIEERLDNLLDIPVFHDDQHGTAIVVLAALRNAARVVDRPLGELRIVVIGAGAAGAAVSLILLDAGVEHLVVVDRQGVLHPDRPGLTGVKARLAARTNPTGTTGSAMGALAGADVLIGLSGGTVTEEAVASMAPGSIIFALANPDPEVRPDIAAKYARVVATGRSDYPNQINNVLAFPGVFLGALQVRASRITTGMRQAAADALAAAVSSQELSESYIVPSVLNPDVAPAIAAAVAEAAHVDGVAGRAGGD